MDGKYIIIIMAWQYNDPWTNIYTQARNHIKAQYGPIVGNCLPKHGPLPALRSIALTFLSCVQHLVEDFKRHVEIEQIR